MGVIRILSLFVSLLAIVADQTVQAERDPFPCGYKYFSEAGAWFKMHTREVYRNEANIKCYTEGAHLASPTSDAIKKAMLSLMVANDKKYDKTSSMLKVHTAMHPADVMKNNSTDPDIDDDFNWNFVALTETGQLQSVDRYSRLPYICYKEAHHDIQLNECGTLDPEYKLDNRTNHCYKFHRDRTSWFEAVSICRNEGGDLAIINSKKETNVIKKIFAKNPADVIPGKKNKDLAFLGHFVNYKGVRKTVKGKESDYYYYYNISCGSVARNGTLFEVSCVHWLPYICEKKVNSCSKKYTE